MPEEIPRVRGDLEFIPVRQGARNMVLIRDHLCIVPEGTAVDAATFQLLALLDGTRSIRDLQMELMRRSGGVIVGLDEVRSLISQLDDAYLLDSERFRAAGDRVMSTFASEKVRPCFFCGRSYPNDPRELTQVLDGIMAKHGSTIEPEGPVLAVVAPHVDIATGADVYASAYGVLRQVRPSRIIILGIGHHMTSDMFCLTEKDYATPLGVARNDNGAVRRLKQVGAGVVAPHDFDHRSEHSIEFQMLFLQHILGTDTFDAVPILCGSLMANLPSYSRTAYVEKAGPFLDELKAVAQEAGKRTLIVAGVDFSHIGLKFGHERPAAYMESMAEIHDRNLLDALCEENADVFWQESIKVGDRFNVCGFSALACLLEIIPPSKGTVLNYRMRHEAATQSAVSFGAVLFSQ